MRQNLTSFNKSVFWIMVLGFSALILYAISSAILPFIIAFALAYLLHPAAIMISQKFQISNYTAGIIVFIGFVTVFSIILFLITPVIYQQIGLFISNIPLYKHTMENYIANSPQIERLGQFLGANDMKDYLKSVLDVWFFVVVRILNNVWKYTVSTISAIVNIVIIPILLFYFLRDWAIMKKTFYSLLPSKSKEKLCSFIEDINIMLSAYIRGQLNICILFAVYLSFALAFLNIDFFLLIGIFSGIAIIIPFIGFLVSFCLAITVCCIKFGISIHALYVAIVFLVGHVLEAYILTPNLIGNKIGVHPLWIFFSVLVCGAALGFKGVFFAIPIAGVIRVLVQHILDIYKKSNYYNI